ncbi:MAG: hypothetical protein WD081_06505 [Gammaproteobacteria bacterium]
MNRGLSFRHVQTLLARVPDLRNSILVGGQALNHWAEVYGIKEYGLALSFDIDFLGGGDAAEEIAGVIGGRAQIAGVSDPHSPNTALVTAKIDGEIHHIDFLGSLHGFSVAELERVKSWAINVRPDAGGPTIRVMHPVHCLESVVANTYGTALNRREGPAGERAAERVRLAVEACRRMTLEYLEHNRERDALRIAEKVHTLSLTGPAMRALHDDEVDVTGAIPLAHMPQPFMERRWPQLERTRGRSVDKYCRLHERRLALAKKKQR